MQLSVLLLPEPTGAALCHLVWFNWSRTVIECGGPCVCVHHYARQLKVKC